MQEGSRCAGAISTHGPPRWPPAGSRLPDTVLAPALAERRRGEGTPDLWMEGLGLIVSWGWWQRIVGDVSMLSWLSQVTD